MLSRFRGCLLGSLMGDCLGSPFEGDAVVSKLHLHNYFSQMLDSNKKLPYKPYTDDTAMSKSVALSLAECKKYDATDLAKRFTKEYFNEPKRGYGSAVHDVFVGLRNSKCEDPYRPAQGMGSFGNGAAMRVHPVALMYHNDQETTIDVSALQSKITHSHKLGYQGAILQSLAVRMALQVDPESLDVNQFADDLIGKMKLIEDQNHNESDENLTEENSYTKRLEIMKKLLAQPELPSIEEVHNLLGVHVSALKSVPTAIFCFLASQKTLPGIDSENKLQRCIHFAISLGGDTDTIAAMAGAISGAQVGEEGVPQALLRHCEAAKDVKTWADKLYDVSQN